MSATNPSLDGAILTPEEVRTYLSDSVQDNHLLDSIEFSDNRILLAMKMAISDYNTMSPATMFQGRDFPSLSVLLDGTCYNLFKGQVALSARNQSRTLMADLLSRSKSVTSTTSNSWASTAKSSSVRLKSSRST